MKEFNSKYGWSSNWGGRGIAMANHVERMRESKPRELVTEDKSYVRKLSALLRNFPTNDFYKSLAKQLVLKGALSPKQVMHINLDFDKYILSEATC
jgi:hypothetical protein